MDISTLTPDKQVKLQYWLDVIRQCRASGLTNQAWCEQHDISLKSYYYWIAKIRKLALEELPRKNHGSRPVREQAVPAPYAAPEFTEVSFCGRQDSSAVPIFSKNSPSIKEYGNTFLLNGTQAHCLPTVEK